MRVALPVFLYTAVIVFSIVDIIMIDPSRVRALPKWGWIMLVIALPLIGVVLWFIIGRERPERRNHGRYPSRPTAPDDDIAFLGQIGREKAQEDRIRDLEERLSELDDDDKKD